MYLNPWVLSSFLITDDRLNTVPLRSVNDAPLDLLSVHFVGRRNELDRLEEAFRSAQSSSPCRCAIHGMPGIGKTQLLLLYAKLSFDRGRYSHIFWVSATSLDKLNQGLAKILDVVGHRDRSLQDQSAKLIAARLWLEESLSSDWLLIFDNVDRSTLDFLRTNLPRRNARGNILFTTRTEDVAKALVNAAGIQHQTLELRAMELQDTAKLLIEDAGIDLTTVTPSGFTRAEDFVKRVGRLPLAVVQAASFMKQTHITLDDMLEMYNNEQKIEVSPQL
jgi:hypothetical protein